MSASAVCRFCGAELTCEVCALGDQPLANALVPMDAPAEPDPRFALRVMVCSACLLVQLEHTVDPATMFGEYHYLSAVSASWRDHTARFAATAVPRFALTPASLVIEVGSNDGTLLRGFQAQNVRCLGIDPAGNIAEQARRDGVPTLTAFFGEQTAAALQRDGTSADLLVANNVLAHAPALVDFVRGLALALAPRGVLSVEVPHVLSMLSDGQFDTVYHEHAFYFSALVLRRVLASAGLAIFDAEMLPTHGGSLRLFAQHAATGPWPATEALGQVIAIEQAAGLDRPERYQAMAEAAARVIDGVRQFLGQARADRAIVAGYGAAAKGTMLLNAANAGPADIAFVADANRLKQGHRIAGCRIPIVPPDHIRVARPDYLLILPWNIAGEIMQSTGFIGSWGGQFVVPSPNLRVVAA